MPVYCTGTSLLVPVFGADSWYVCHGHYEGLNRKIKSDKNARSEDEEGAPVDQSHEQRLHRHERVSGTMLNYDRRCSSVTS